MNVSAHTDAVKAMALILDRRGPTGSADLCRLLAGLDIQVDESDLDGLARSAGAVRVTSADGDRYALVAAAGGDRVRDLLHAVPAWFLAVLLLATILVSMLIVANVNHGVRDHPTIDWSPPSEAGETVEGGS